ncbi:formylglycine-generating enzyme family protein [Agaribacterium sp. ZY112]|uniref:formylglycine-generating enzyme family protein n=1 Tax=Agaribacterium sp. ZY112 TaxID=3233574 RepID=UPI003523EF50
MEIIIMFKLYIQALSLCFFFSVSLLSWSAPYFIEPALVKIPKGSLSLPHAPGEEKSKVHIPSFMVSKYELTNKEFALFVASTAYSAPTECVHEITGTWYSLGATKGSWSNNALNKKDYDPVTCIGWQAASDYAAWLSQVTGKSYRLLSAHEWAYAASAGLEYPFYHSAKGETDEGEDAAICDYANIAEQSAEREARLHYGALYKTETYNNPTLACDDGVGFVSIVGMYKPNPFGLYDMLGNITEYIKDCEPASDLNSDQTDRREFVCSKVGLKGGSWHWAPWPFERTNYLPINFIGSLEGTRLALDLVGEQSSKSVNVIGKRDKTQPNANGLSLDKQNELFEQGLANAQAEQRLSRMKKR